MYRVAIILSAALSLAACTSGGMGDAPASAPAPSMDTVRFESRPAGAEVKISDTQSCRTPCALNLPVKQTLFVAFSLPGYLIVSKALEPKAGTIPVQLEPNPVSVDFIADPALKQKKAAVKRPRPRKPTPIQASPPSAAPVR